MENNVIPPVLPVWKKEGESTHYIAQQVSKKYGVPSAHTGILDPLASGVVVVLLGDERYKKDGYTAGLKKYEVSMLVGLSTDTHDLMGLVTEHAPDIEVAEEHVQKVLPHFLGPQEQMPPSFSAQMYDGKRLFQHAKDGSLSSLNVSPRSIEIHEIQLLGQSVVTNSELEERVFSVVKSVRGDFRQDEILAHWPPYLKDSNKYRTFTLSVTTGRGAYVRGLIRDLGESLKVPLVTYSLSRTENAGFVRGDCITLAELL